MDLAYVCHAGFITIEDSQDSGAATKRDHDKAPKLAESSESTLDSHIGLRQ